MKDVKLKSVDNVKKKKRYYYDKRSKTKLAMY